MDDTDEKPSKLLECLAWAFGLAYTLIVVAYIVWTSLPLFGAA